MNRKYIMQQLETINKVLHEMAVKQEVMNLSVSNLLNDNPTIRKTVEENTESIIELKADARILKWVAGVLAVVIAGIILRGILIVLGG